MSPFDPASIAAEAVAEATAPPAPWGVPDMGVLQTRRAPPAFPLALLGPEWSRWVADAAEAAAAPVDYVAMPLLAGTSALIGNARWALATPGWREPPHLWLGVVGDSGSSKSPGADCLIGQVLPEIERRMAVGFPERLKKWTVDAETAKAKLEAWQKDCREATKKGYCAPSPPEEAPPQPQPPRIRVNDITIEKMADILANAAPKGVMIIRDELAGWLLGMNAYNDAGRAFWLESYGGRCYSQDRKNNPLPYVIPRFAVAAYGGTQPDKLVEICTKAADDGLFARFVWAWPEARPFKIGRGAPRVDFAITALDKLRALDLAPGDADRGPQPVYVPLDPEAVNMIETFGQTMQQEQQNAAGLLRSAYGKARGLALRLSLNLEFLRWCAAPGSSAPPSTISADSLGAACDLVSEYFMPMAARVYGDAAAPETDRNAATLARWISQNKPAEVHVRELQRKVRLPGLGTAEAVHAAALLLVEADWLRRPAPGSQNGRSKAAYPVNPALLGAAP